MKKDNTFRTEKDLEIIKDRKLKYMAYFDLRPEKAPVFQRFFYRARRRIGAELMKLLKFNNTWALSYAPEKLYRLALKEKADLYVSHLETGLLVGCKLIRSGKKVSFDFEDWYSKDYISAERPISKLAKLEEFALKNGTFCTAASNAMGNALINTYSNSKEITTIYNSFPELSDLKKNEIGSSSVKILWTSRTVGPDRGLETLMEALILLENQIELHIIGDCVAGYEDFILNSLRHTNHLLFFHGFLKHSELIKKIQDFNIGLAIEQYTPDSRNKTITNKILQYIQAGLMVLATDTDGQSEIAHYFPNSVFLVSSGNPESWKTTLQGMIISLNKHDRNMQKSLFRETFSWESQKKKLEQLIKQHV